MKKQIFVYCDEGVSPFSLSQFVKSLRYLNYPIKTIRSKAVINGDWMDNAILFAMPGGRDAPYHKLLSGIGTNNIRSFVEKGGNYLGICAGAYFASKEVVFHEGNPSLRICGKRDLCFFPGTAYGPLYNVEKFDYNSDKGAFPAELKYEGKVFKAFYNGGCYFKDAENFGEDVKVIARYNDNDLAAIVYSKFGKGAVVLSGVHIEYSFSELQKREIPLNVLNELKRDDNERQNIFKEIMGFLNL